MILEGLYTVDEICRLSGKQFVMLFSGKMELRWIKSSPLLSKWMDVNIL